MISAYWIAILQPCKALLSSTRNAFYQSLSEQAKFTKHHVQVNHFEHMHMTFLYHAVSRWKLKAALAITARCVWRHVVCPKCVQIKYDFIQNKTNNSHHPRSSHSFTGVLYPSASVFFRSLPPDLWSWSIEWCRRCCWGWQKWLVPREEQ